MSKEGDRRIVIKLFIIPRRTENKSVRGRQWLWGRCRVLQELQLKAGDWFMHPYWINIERLECQTLE